MLRKIVFAFVMVGILGLAAACCQDPCAPNPCNEPNPCNQPNQCNPCDPCG